MSDAQEIEILEPEEMPGLLMVPNAQSLANLDSAVDRISALATTYVCATEQDYVAGGEEVVRIRSLSTTFEAVFSPIKRFWSEKHKGAVADESKRVGALKTARETIAGRMLTWKRAEDEKDRIIQEERQRLERQQAEEERLAIAERIAQTAAGKSPSTADAIRQAALSSLDRPVDVAPVPAPSSVPKLQGVKVVERIRPEIFDMGLFLICVGATLLLQGKVKAPVRKAMEPFLNQFAATLLQNPEFVEKMTAGFKPWLIAAHKQGGTSFEMPGVRLVKTDGLG